MSAISLRWLDLKISLLVGLSILDGFMEMLWRVASSVISSVLVQNGSCGVS